MPLPSGMGRQPWFERTFEFPFPASWHEDIVERFAGLPARVEDWVRRIPPEHLTARIGGTWSIQENIGHVLDLEALFGRRFGEFLEGKTVLSPADVTNAATHAAGHNQRPIGEIVAALRTAREAQVERLRSLDDTEFERVAVHPRLKKAIRLIDAVCFVCCHDDYHLARISKLARQASRGAG